jgi:hypothetical protein
MISKYPVELPVKMLLDHSDSVINSDFLLLSVYIPAFEGLKRGLLNGVSKMSFPGAETVP